MNEDKSNQLGNIVIKLLQLRTQMYIYHWQTSIYARHKASDTLIDSLGKNIDMFVETIQGTLGFKLKVYKECNMQLLNINDRAIIVYIKKHITWLKHDFLKSLYKISGSKDNISDILNIRDEILNDLNKTLYLFTLR